MSNEYTDDNQLCFRYCAKSGANLQPPVGFRPNLAHFHKFLETQLKRSSLRIDADGSDTMMNSDDNPACPEDWFQPVSVYKKQLFQ